MASALALGCWAVVAGTCAGGETAGSAGANGGTGMGSVGGGTGGTGGNTGNGGSVGGTGGNTGNGASAGGTGGNTGNGGSVGGAGNSGNAGIDAGGTGGATTDGGLGAAIPLPMVVSDYYSPSGFMGDGQTIAGAVTFDLIDCKAPRATDARGNCYKVTYRPPPLDVGQTVRWAGVYWQAPQNNWGEVPGNRIEPGARQISFFAAGESGGESIKFRAGGIMSANRTQQPHADTFTVETTLPLTTTWTKQTLPLGTSTYNEVIGAFCWVAEATTTTPIVFYVDGIVWEK